MSTGRNDPCPCGSGKKYKRCCQGSGEFAEPEKSPQLTPRQQLDIANSAFSLGDISRARQALEPLINRSRVSAGVWALACRIEMGEKNFVKARDCIARAVELEPENYSYLYNYATALALSGEQEKAVLMFERALAVKPDLWVAYHNLAHALRDLGRSSEAVERYLRAFYSGELNIGTMSQILLSMHLFCMDDHDKLFAMHCKLGEEIAAQNPRVDPAPRVIRKGEKIRLGYLSPRFSREVVGYFFKPLFDNHNRENFEIYLYCATPRKDELTEYLSAKADKWIDIGKMSDSALCQQVVDDEIDILLDLAGHAPENRMTAIARKPAPIQISMLDYFDTTGVAALDYYVTDHFSTPDDTPQQFTERLIYLNQPRLVYEAPDYAPPVAIREPSGGLVFGSFNRHHKIVPQVVQTWSALLRAVPDSRLLLKSPRFSSADVQKNFLERFAACGIDKARIEFRGSSPHVEMLAEYGDIDIALDTFPYNGGLTTCEALWMGTPVLTLLGNRIISRQTAGMLHAVGLPQFVAGSETQFAEIGKYWSEHREQLNSLRGELRPMMATSSLTDAPAYTRDLEVHLQRIWNEYLVAHGSS